MRKRSVFLTVASALLTTAILFANDSFAQNYLSKPVKIVVPSGPGSIADTVARAFALALSTELSQTFFVENKIGANGILGAEAVAKAPADGTTILVGNVSTHAANAALYKNLPYDPNRDFVPISHVGNIPYVLVVGPSVSASKFADIVALSKANIGKLTYASGSAPSIVGMEAIKRASGMDVLLVPYKTVPQGITDVLSGRVDMMVADVGVAVPLINSGKLRAIVTAAQVRTTILPNVPSLIEVGISGVDIVGWWGWYAPAGTPAVAVRRIADALVKLASEKEMKDRLAKFGAELTAGSPEHLAAFTRQQGEMYQRMIRAAGIEPE